MKPVLVIMAAGMGSRFGGLKQIAPVDDKGNIIIDFSIYDAVQAGFEKVVFIIKKQIEEEFKACVGDRLSKYIQVEYVYQELDKIPAGYEVPADRVKPFGTGHAVLCAKEVVDGPFVVINADDYYGRGAFQAIYDYLIETKDDDKYRYAMVGYELHNTLTENGHVSRGICEVDRESYLMDITERTRIEQDGVNAKYTEDDGVTWNGLDAKTIVSMNMWGFTNSFFAELEKRFIAFLDTQVVENPLKAEYFLPSVVDQLLKEDKATAKVLTSPDKWYGVTYQEDKPVVMAAIQSLKDSGMYPDVLWK